VNELHVGIPVVVAGVTLIPVERLRIVAEVRGQAGWLQATKKTFALVVCDADGTRAIGPNGQPLCIQHLFDAVPGLHASLPIE